MTVEQVGPETTSADTHDFLVRSTTRQLACRVTITRLAALQAYKGYLRQFYEKQRLAFVVSEVPPTLPPMPMDLYAFRRALAMDIAARNGLPS